MSFLAPLFLLGLSAIALPLWLHRLKSQSPERQPFSSTMLLEASEQRIHVRRQLQYWLLLALRILLLGLLALAFAKPVLERPPAALAATPPVLHLIVLDTSLSMGYGDRMERAGQQVEQIIDQSAARDRLQFITAGGPAAAVRVAAGRDRAALGSALASVSSGPHRVDLGELIGSLSGLTDPGGGSEESIVVHLVSDLQVSGLPTRFADLVPGSINGRPVELILHPVTKDDADNWAIEFARANADAVEVGVRSFAAVEASRSVMISVNGETTDSVTRTIPAGGQAVFTFPLMNLAAGDNRLIARLAPGDALATDDVRFAVLDNAPPAPVLVLTSGGAALPATYLSTALASVPRGYTAEVTPVAELDSRVLVRYPWVAIDDLGIVGDRLSAALGEYLRAGGNVLAAVGEAALGRRQLPLTGHALNEANGPVNVLRSVTRVESGHPVLAGTRGWRAVSVARALPLTPGAEDRVLIELSDGQPLLLERQVGGGRLLLLTTKLDSAWSDLAVQPVFVNFMAEVATYLSGEEQLQRQQIAGNSLSLRQSGGVSGQVIDPLGREILRLADTRRAASIPLSQTGFYEVYTPGKDALMAVNPDLRESDLATMSESARSDWQRLLTSPSGAAASAEAISIPAAPLALWKAVLFLLAVIFLAESLVGNGYLGQQRGTP